MSDSGAAIIKSRSLAEKCCFIHAILLPEIKVIIYSYIKGIRGQRYGLDPSADVRPTPLLLYLGMTQVSIVNGGLAELYVYFNNQRERVNKTEEKHSWGKRRIKTFEGILD